MSRSTSVRLHAAEVQSSGIHENGNNSRGSKQGGRGGSYRSGGGRGNDNGNLGIGKRGKYLIKMIQLNVMLYKERMMRKRLMW